MITVKEKKNGRVIVESDGYSDYYKAYVKDAIVCKISLPQKQWDYYAQDAECYDGKTIDYSRCLSSLLSDIDSGYNRPAGTVVISRSKVF